MVKILGDTWYCFSTILAPITRYCPKKKLQNFFYIVSCFTVTDKTPLAFLVSDRCSLGNTVFAVERHFLVYMASEKLTTRTNLYSQKSRFSQKLVSNIAKIPRMSYKGEKFLIPQHILKTSAAVVDFATLYLLRRK